LRHTDSDDHDHDDDGDNDDDDDDDDDDNQTLNSPAMVEQSAADNKTTTEPTNHPAV